MGRSFKRDAVAPTASEEDDEGEEEKPEAITDVFRRPSNEDSNGGNGRKMPLHSGLSALIQAATTQLGQLDGDNTANSSSTTPRYTPHGFHTSSTSTAFNAIAPPSSTLQTTPILGPEASTTTEARQQTFPEVLMTVLEDTTNADVITFLPDGKFFALRRKEFSETTMMNYFSATSFSEFLEKIHSWGFHRIDRGDPCSGIEIFRHAMFAKGDWERCSRICFGESPTDVRLSALPDRARIEYTLSDESTLAASKRRLSPSHARRGSESSLSKQRLSSSEFDIAAISKSESADTTSTDASATYRNGLSHNSDSKEATPTAEDDIRSLALAITTEKLNLKTDVEDHVEASTPLIEKAVENATCTIVTDAIETLLRDEGHTRETYLKHEQELSRSSLPGVVPISKQLFARQPPDIQEHLLAAAAAAAKVITICDSNGEKKPELEQQKEQHEEAVVVDDNEGRATDPIPESSSEDQTPPAELTSASDEGVAMLKTTSST